MRLHLISAAALIGALSACTTVPEPVPQPVEVILPSEPIQTCAPVSALQQVIIPAETKIQYAITMIDNPPYEPIQNKVKQTKVVKPAQIIYVDSAGKEVFDICEPVQRGDTGPGIGEIVEG